MTMDGHTQKQWQWQYLTLGSTTPHGLDDIQSLARPADAAVCAAAAAAHLHLTCLYQVAVMLHLELVSHQHVTYYVINAWLSWFTPFFSTSLLFSFSWLCIYFPFLWCLLLEVSVYACEVRSKNCDGGASGGLCSLDIAKRVMNEDIEDVLENQDPGHSTRAFSRFWWLESLNYAILSTSRP